MSRDKATADTLDSCQKILDLAASKVEDFIAGKSPKGYGGTQMAKEIASELDISLSLVAPLVSLFIKKDDRITSNKGRYNGGLQLNGVVKDV